MLAPCGGQGPLQRVSVQVQDLQRLKSGGGAPGGGQWPGEVAVVEEQRRQVGGALVGPVTGEAAGKQVVREVEVAERCRRLPETGGHRPRQTASATNVDDPTLCCAHAPANLGRRRVRERYKASITDPEHQLQ